jgi:hypothetical protein
LGVRVRGRLRVRVKVRARVRIRARVRARNRARVRVRVRARNRARGRVRADLGGVASAAAADGIHRRPRRSVGPGRRRVGGGRTGPG